MSDFDKSLGTGSDIEFEGRQWTMAPLTYELQAKYSAFLLKRAVSGVKMQKEYLTQEEFDNKMDQIDRNWTAGVYSPGSKVCSESAKSLDGLKELVRICLFKNHPEVNHEFVDRLFTEKQAEAARTLNQLNSDPLSATTQGQPS